MFASFMVKIQSFGDEGVGLEMLYGHCSMPLHLATVCKSSKRKQSITFGAGMTAGVAGNLSVMTVNRLRSSNTDFLSGLLP